MTLPAGSVLLPLPRRANAGSFFSAGWSRGGWGGGGRLGGGRERGRRGGSGQAGRCHTPHSFFRTRAVLLTCVYCHYPWCPPPPPLAGLRLSPRLTGLMVCETGREREGSSRLCGRKVPEKMHRSASAQMWEEEAKACFAVGVFCARQAAAALLRFLLWRVFRGWCSWWITWESSLGFLSDSSTSLVSDWLTHWRACLTCRVVSASSRVFFRGLTHLSVQGDFQTTLMLNYYLSVWAPDEDHNMNNNSLRDETELRSFFFQTLLTSVWH